ncbi:zinc finger protein RFP-like [Sceloporus undulatus]|uniref:zinc finger protein RFP-like n=1 Tax=Sceloporus undulatus TaxID=8520 RepID=UPI001C4B67B5|nr:zinc finger protein RFP-like [Sceloporus undulatus]
MSLGGMSAEQQLQQRLLRSRLRASSQLLSLSPAPAPPPLLLPPLSSPLSPPSPPDSPPPGTTPAEIPAGPRYPSETWCSLCRVYCPDPVCLPCGHNFCTGCIGQRLAEPKLSISCLECGATARKRNLRPIKPPPLLASLAGERSKRPRLEPSPAPAPPPPPAPTPVCAAPSPPVTTAAPSPPAPAAPPTPPPTATATAPSPTGPGPATPPLSAAAASRRAPLTPTGAGGGAGEGDGGGRRCEKHQAPLQFFCEEDQSPICAHCDRSQEHRAHTIFHVERAARDYRERVQAQLEILKQEKNTLWSQKLTGEKKIQEYMEKVKTERKEIVSEFEHLHQFLKDQEQRLLTQLEEIDKEIERQKDEMVTKLSEELSRLGDVITEMEAKCKQPASEFLQDIKKNMNRCAAGQFQLFEETPKLEGRLDDISRKGEALKETLRRFQDNIISAVEKGEIARALNDTADATLNSDVMSILQLDQRNARCEESQRRLPALQYVPDMPETVDSRALVLGCDGFTSGRYFWELEVGDGEFWALGVTRDPSKKKGVANFSPEEGIWAVGLWKGQHWALTSPVTPLSLSKHPRRIRVSLDYVGECVTFTDADTEDPIFTFPPASFNGTRTHPLLWVVGFPAQAVFLRRMGVKYPTAVHEMDVLSP